MERKARVQERNKQGDWATLTSLERSIKTEKSKALYDEARKYAPMGVHGSAKWYPPYPLYLTKALGARIVDVDDNEFIDYWAGAGPIIVGHGNPEVNQAVFDTVQKYGTNYCHPHVREVELARKLSQLIPCAEMSAFCNAGSDAVMYAVRLARAHTDRMKIIKFEGSYQGWSDSLVMNVTPRREDAGPALFPKTAPESAGLLPDAIKNTIVLPYNNPDVVEQTVKREKGNIAAIAVEPMVSSSNIMPKEGYLKALRQICDSNDIILIFDEIITGFRHGLGGAQSIFGVIPDVAAFGKAMANGWFIAAVCGKREYMSTLSPEGPAFFSGTYNGSVTNVAASLKTIEILGRPGFYERLYGLGNMMREGINRTIQKLGIKARCDGFGSIWCLYFGGKEVEDYRDIIDVAHTLGSPKDQAYRNWLLNHGIFLLPQRVNRGYLYAAHTEEDVQTTVDVTSRFLEEYRDFLK